jgi:hypothetical protein
MEKDVMSMELVKFDVTEAEISELRSRYMMLTIQGLDDKPGFDAVHRARIDIKTRRVFIEKKGKDFRAKAVAFQKAVLTEEHRLIGLLSPIEDYLSDEESRVEEERTRIKAEADAKAAAIIQNRINRLFELGCRFDGISYSYGTLIAPQALIKTCTDEQYETFLGAIRVAVENDALKREAEDRTRQEEAARLLKVAKEQEIERNRINDEYKAIQDEKNRLAKEKKDAEDAKIKAEQEKIRAAELKKAQEEAAEKASKETAERIQRETEAKWAKEKAEAEEKIRSEEVAKAKAARKEARRPDKAKLLSFVETFLAIGQPDLKTEDGQIVWDEIWIILQRADKEIRALVEKL